MNSRAVIVFFSLCFFFSAGILFWHNEHLMDPHVGKNWWTLSFEDPNDPSNFHFRIENHSNHENFTYQIMKSKAILEEKSVSIPRGDSLVIEYTLPAHYHTAEIVVTTDGESKTIYRK